jgi:hypothetical protein
MRRVGTLRVCSFVWPRLEARVPGCKMSATDVWSFFFSIGLTQGSFHSGRLLRKQANLSVCAGVLAQSRDCEDFAWA